MNHESGKAGGLLDTAAAGASLDNPDDFLRSALAPFGRPTNSSFGLAYFQTPEDDDRFGGAAAGAESIALGIAREYDTDHWEPGDIGIHRCPALDEAAFWGKFGEAAVHTAKGGGVAL